jgi:MFS family permease
MAITYGYGFGVELTVDNVISQYMFDQFHLPLSIAGMLGSVFGMMNLFSRPSGGMISDYAAKRFGMRGRLWVMWVIQSLSAVFCILLGLVSNSLGATMAILIIFSIFCQQSCGLSFGIVPFVSKRSTGLVSGFVGAGGNAGGAVTQAIFFTYLSMPTDKAFVWMGVMSLVRLVGSSTGPCSSPPGLCMPPRHPGIRALLAAAGAIPGLPALLRLPRSGLTSIPAHPTAAEPPPSPLKSISAGHDGAVPDYVLPHVGRPVCGP